MAYYNPSAKKEAIECELRSRFEWPEIAVIMVMSVLAFIAIWILP